jgi:Cysteine-rich secretory protein family
MLRLSFVLLTILTLTLGILVIYQHRPAAAVSTSGCIDIAANPDYLRTSDAHDAIAAINNARQQEHLRPLRLPANFYQLDPAQQQFILLNLERTDRHLHPLRMDANLSQVALAYSRQLLDLHFFSHTSPISGSFSERVGANPTLASHFSHVAENLAGNPVPGIGPMYEYMYDDASENCGHRQNILNPELTLVGVNWVRGGEYGSMSAQEFLTSAPWSLYTGTAAPDTIAPQVSINVHTLGQGRLQYTAEASDNAGIARITWFLDSIQKPLHIGPQGTLDTQQVAAGRHMLIVYAVDGEGNFGVARYSIMM